MIQSAANHKKAKPFSNKVAKLVHPSPILSVVEEPVEVIEEAPPVNVEPIADAPVETVADVVEPLIGAEIVAEIAPEDDAPPTREELVAKAEELGLEFRKNISETKLLSLIEAELASELEA